MELAVGPALRHVLLTPGPLRFDRLFDPMNLPILRFDQPLLEMKDGKDNRMFGDIQPLLDPLRCGVPIPRPAEQICNEGLFPALVGTNGVPADRACRILSTASLLRAGALEGRSSSQTQTARSAIHTASRTS